MNQLDVQVAIHANTHLGYNWSECSNILNYDMFDQLIPMEPIYDWLQTNAPHLQITVYSGDDDSVCGSLGTQEWMWGLNRPVLTNWTSWTDPSGQVGGYLVQWQGISLVTVHHAGHMVPTFQPARALYLLTQYLAGLW